MPGGRARTTPPTQAAILTHTHTYLQQESQFYILSHIVSHNNYKTQILSGVEAYIHNGSK